MAEIGTGAGSSYPASLDTNNILEYDKESADKTLVRADIVNDLASAIVAIQTELGTNPAGSYTDLVTRLANMYDIIIVGASATSTITAALAAVTTTKKDIYVPPGNYVFTSTLTISANGIRIFGCGETSRVYTSTTTIHGITISSYNGCRFENFKLEGPSAGNYSGIYLTGSSSRCIIGPGMYITGWGSYSVEENDSGTADYNLVHGNILTGNVQDPSVHFRFDGNSVLGSNAGA